VEPQKTTKAHGMDEHKIVREY